MAMKEAPPGQPISAGHASSNLGRRCLVWRRRVAAFVLGAASVLSTSATAQETRSLVAPSSVPGGEAVVAGYGGSYALVVGMSDYAQGTGWQDLESVPGEIAKVERALRARGFEVVTHHDPDAQGLKRAFEDFIGSYGYDEGHRLLFYVSGHGYTLDNGRNGYLVPTDAPNPSRNEPGFRRKALSMTQIMAWAREMSAKHALFLFDSCFSGTIFKTRSQMPGVPPHIDRLAAEPVRQFITAGSAGEVVPARSTFTPAFVDALEGKGDLNRDGYVTGMELGLHLQAKVPEHEDQTPQFGKIRDYELSRGDFVFRVNGLVVRDTLTVTTEPPDAQVRVVMNGRNVHARPGMEIEPGRYMIEVEARDHETFRQYLDVSGDTRYEISLCRLRERTERVCEDKEMVRHRSVEGSESSSISEFEAFDYDHYERNFRYIRGQIKKELCDSAYNKLRHEIKPECSDIGGSYVDGSLTEDTLDCDCEIEGEYFGDHCTVTAAWQCRVREIEPQCHDSMRTERVCPENQVIRRK